MSVQEIENLRRQLVSKPREEISRTQTPRKKRADYTLQEWTEYKRAKEREYDAKRRARKREEGASMNLEQRRELREGARRKANPPPSCQALDTVIAALQGLEKAAASREEPASGALAELESHLRERVQKLKVSIRQ